VQGCVTMAIVGIFPGGMCLGITKVSQCYIQ
jgi:hypothetical protein